MIKHLAGVAVGAVICATASAQSLDDRIRELERRVGQLERQAAQPAPATSAPKAATTASKPETSASKSVPSQPDGWKKKENWRAIKRGMSKNEVSDILGEPLRMDVNPGGYLFEYPGGGQAHFGRNDGRLERWRESR